MIDASSTGSVTKGPFGTGTVTLNGAAVNAGVTADQTIANAITIAENTTFATQASEKSLTFSGATTLANGDRTLTVNLGTTVAGKGVTFSNAIGDNGQGLGIIKAGTGLLTLSGNNTYGGTTTLTAGKTQIGVGSVGWVGSITSSALGKGTLTFNGGTLSSDSSTDRTILNAVSFTGNAGLGDATNTGKLTFSAAADLGTTVRTITANSDAQFDGIISGALGGITKAGSGTLTLSNASNSYTGATLISAGALNLTGNIASSSLTTINGATAVLTGTGTAGAVTLTSGALTPGTSSAIGNLNTGALNIAAGQTLNSRLGSTGNASRVAATGLTLPTTGLPIRVNLTDNANAGSLGNLGNGNYSLITYSGSLTGGNSTFNKTLNVTSSPLINKFYTFSNTGATNGVVNLAIANQAPVLLHDTFNRATNLSVSNVPTMANGVLSGNTWTSSTLITTSATTPAATFSSTCSAYAAYTGFTPQAGNVYTLSGALNASGGTATNWLALGFANSTPAQA